MLRYVALRLVASVPVILGVAVAVFFIMHVLPGDPTQIMAAEYGASAADMARLRSQLGLDEPLPKQFADFFFRAIQGDLGRSLFTQRPVLGQIMDALPSTAQLAVASLALALALGVPLGVLAATRRNSWIDAASMVIALLGVSMPSFWLGLLLIFVFAFWLGWLPSAGVGGVDRLILPAVALGLHSVAVIARLTRSSMLEVLRQEYVTTARAKGLSNGVVLVQHALKNALIPLVTFVGLQFGALLGGAVIIETVFARKGIGSLAVNAILQKDYPLVQGTVLFVAVAYVAVNLAVDLCYAYLDPRIRYD